MFTGIIKELGIVRGSSPSASLRTGPSASLTAGGLYRLEIESKDIYDSLKIGESAAVNGVCLTLVRKKKNLMTFDVMRETLERTNLSSLKAGVPVNLEGPLKAGEALSGHFVLGHIDCLGRITNIERKGDEAVLEIEIPNELASLIVEKGSVAIEGASLTVGEITNNRFRAYLIPHTLKSTTLGSTKRQDALNIEFDILGKYILRASSLEKGARITEEFLRTKGFYQQNL